MKTHIIQSLSNATLRKCDFSQAMRLQWVRIALKAISRSFGRHRMSQLGWESEILGSMGWDLSEFACHFNKTLGQYFTWLEKLDRNRFGNDLSYEENPQRIDFLSSFTSILEKHNLDLQEYVKERWCPSILESKIPSCKSLHQYNSIIENYILGRALTSPAVVDSFYIKSEKHTKLTSDCIWMVSLSVRKNGENIEKLKDLVWQDNITLSEFRDIFFERILHAYGVGLDVSDLPDIPACFVSVGNRKKIFVDQKLNSFEKSFAVAHELGHFLFKDKSSLEYLFGVGDEEEHDLQEYRCDQFANVMIRALEGLFVSFGGDITQRDYAPGMIDLAGGKGNLKRTPQLNRSGGAGTTPLADCALSTRLATQTTQRCSDFAL